GALPAVRVGLVASVTCGVSGSVSADDGGEGLDPGGGLAFEVGGDLERVVERARLRRRRQADVQGMQGAGVVGEVNDGEVRPLASGLRDQEGFVGTDDDNLLDGLPGLQTAKVQDRR